MVYPDRIHLGQWTLPGGLYIMMWLQNKPWIWSSTLFVFVCIPAHLYGVATMKGLIYIYFQVRYVGPCFTMYVCVLRYISVNSDRYRRSRLAAICGL